MSVRVMSYLVFLLFVANLAYSIDLKYGCLLTKCWKSVLTCKLDRGCNQFLSCVQKCGSDQQCSAVCSFSHEDNAQLQSFLQCLVDHSCLKQDQKCPLPKANSVLPSFDLRLLTDGPWYVIRGLNPAYDCWQCQRMSFTIKQQSGPLVLDYRYDMNITSSMAKTIQCSTEYADPKIADGQLIAKYTVLNKFSGEDQWKVLKVSEDKQFILIHYCGVSEVSSRYEGGIVMSKSRNGLIPYEVYESFQSALSQAGLSLYLKDFCKLNLRGCSFSDSSNTPPFQVQI
ncbi:hypothetical protein MIR68_005731 [Amoeboaphelidium protococcarum]|nr:hypothetical protein MIR68_005731 [Amoeboaphelidium protococcarum]KAI3645907.1 hypothetical protein MP228_008835 [Amoeboaphelidium protococcarum]